MQHWPVQTPTTGVLHQGRPGSLGESASTSGVDSYSRPESSAVSDVWLHLMLGYSIFTIESHTDCSICSPVTDMFIHEIRAEESSFPENVEEPSSRFWLARAIAEATAEKIKAEGYENEWRADKYVLHGPLIRKHKKESFDFGTSACHVKQCNSVRPSFVLEAHREDVATDLMYVYIPMGLERPHQSSVFSRFFSHELASCYLAVASESSWV